MAGGGAGAPRAGRRARGGRQGRRRGPGGAAALARALALALGLGLGLGLGLRGARAQGSEGPVEAMEVSSQKVEFGRQAPFPYQVCREQPGAVQLDDSTQPSAQCIPINLDDLTFCSMVNYDACMRVPAPGVYDDAVSDAYSLRMNYWQNEQPSFYSKGCADLFKAYFCHLSYPQCLKYEEVDADAAKSNAREGQYVELPLCWDYCFSTAQTCIGDKALAEKFCLTQVEIGKVSADRPDMVGLPDCMNRGALFRAALSVLLLCWAALAAAL